MDLFVWLLIGILATWRMTHDITNQMELDGPFNLYTHVRAFFQREFWPVWVQDGITCPYCVSFWFGHLVALLLPIYTGIDLWRGLAAYFAVSWALSGAIVIYLRLMKVFHDLDGDEV